MSGFGDRLKMAVTIEMAIKASGTGNDRSHVRAENWRHSAGTYILTPEQLADVPELELLAEIAKQQGRRILVSCIYDRTYNTLPEFAGSVPRSLQVGLSISNADHPNLIAPGAIIADGYHDLGVFEIRQENPLFSVLGAVCAGMADQEVAVPLISQYRKRNQATIPWEVYAYICTNYQRMICEPYDDGNELLARGTKIVVWDYDGLARGNATNLHVVVGDQLVPLDQFKAAYIVAQTVDQVLAERMSAMGYHLVIALGAKVTAQNVVTGTLRGEDRTVDSPLEALQGLFINHWADIRPYTDVYIDLTLACQMPDMLANHTTVLGTLLQYLQELSGTQLNASQVIDLTDPTSQPRLLADVLRQLEAGSSVPKED
jgi:hypothetical protein